ncbi:tetratricopeptide repeat protein [bacterium]|nr:tetratricopeptide repeat protein [bacterium]
MLKHSISTIFLLVIFLVNLSFASDQELPDLDKLWDYNDPAATESVFRELIPKAKEANDTSYHAIILTQVARAQGLQGKFEQAHATLDSVLELLKRDYKVATVRYMLERGRVYNSSGERNKAREFFLNAWDNATKSGEDYYALDAAHMMGIVEKPEKQLEWNLQAIKIAESSEDQKTQAWLGALYNNIGWTYHNLGEYEKALDVFQKALDWRIKMQSLPEIRIARWCVGRTLRSLNRIDEALQIQIGLLKEIEDKKAEPDGYVYEELGELLLLQDKEKKARKYFKTAYEILSQDAWLVEHEQERLQRIKELGGLE